MQFWQALLDKGALITASSTTKCRIPLTNLVLTMLLPLFYSEDDPTSLADIATALDPEKNWKLLDVVGRESRTDAEVFKHLSAGTGAELAVEQSRLIFSVVI